MYESPTIHWRTIGIREYVPDLDRLPADAPHEYVHLVSEESCWAAYQDAVNDADRLAMCGIVRFSVAVVPCHCAALLSQTLVESRN